ncbi:MAG: glycerate kinase [Chryseolinea sp.]
MRILIAPDKFKGSMSATEAGEAIREGLLTANSNVECIVVPLADGGEGTTEVLTKAAHGSFQAARVRDPFGKEIIAQYGLSIDNRTAFMEMASASGLHLVPGSQRNPLYTSTIGTGDLIRHALNCGVRDICIGIGGTATNDAGMGAMIALGVEYRDRNGSILEGHGDSLQHIDTIDVSKLHPGIREATFTIFCDVDNPLYGQRGAAYVFAPQKGAAPEAVEILDRGLRNYEAVLQRYGYANTNFPGAGAGGGLPVSLCVFANAKIKSGISFIMDFVHLERQVLSSDVVITGEGKLDDQTLSGKVVKGVASMAAQHGKPLVVVAGASALDRADLSRLSVAHLITLVDSDTTAETAIANAEAIIRKRVQDNYLKITTNGQGTGLTGRQ